ncbi:TPA: hypothetical protein DCF80_00940 [Candidatus Saccharibacteria bacterium]|nr:hypothetical protein [Candidatus Saccharibacteria bacterium]HRK40726.1 hypothetical protein [Candidatus Saccharibacteria bacterium]
MTELLNSSEASQISPERYNLASFEEYRRLSDLTEQEFRKVGLQDQDAFEKALSDPRTVYVMAPDGKQYPFLAPLEYEKMYEFERCQDMTGQKNVMLLSIPLNTPNLEDFRIDRSSLGDADEFAVIVEAFRHDPNEEKNLEYIAKTFGLAEMNFPHPDLRDVPGHEYAWMASYGLTFGPKDNKEIVNDSEVDIQQELSHAWIELSARRNQPELPDDTSNGTYVLSAEQLAELPEVIDELWAISESGFGKILGAHHPVSMEFNKQFFEKQISAPDTRTAIHFVDGRAACFGFIGLTMDNNEWLNTESPAIRADIKGAEQRGETYAHFYELISNGLAGMGYSKHILETFFELANITGRKYRVFFESTNLSATYIPAIIRQEIDSSSSVEMIKDVEELGRLYYAALVPVQAEQRLEDTR